MRRIQDRPPCVRSQRTLTYSDGVQAGGLQMRVKPSLDGRSR